MVEYNKLTSGLMCVRWVIFDKRSKWQLANGCKWQLAKSEARKTSAQQSAKLRLIVIGPRNYAKKGFDSLLTVLSNGT